MAPVENQINRTPSSTALRNARRLRLALPIRLTFSETKAGLNALLTCTYDVSEHGARIGCTVPLEIGETVTVERKNRKAKYQVVWIGSVSDHDNKLAGIQALSSNNPLWDHETRKLLEERSRKRS